MKLQEVAFVGALAGCGASPAITTQDSHKSVPLAEAAEPQSEQQSSVPQLDVDANLCAEQLNIIARASAEIVRAMDANNCVEVLGRGEYQEGPDGLENARHAMMDPLDRDNCETPLMVPRGRAVLAYVTFHNSGCLTIPEDPKIQAALKAAQPMSAELAKRKAAIKALQEKRRPTAPVR